MSFGVDSDGNYGYYKVGADTVTPFSYLRTGTFDNDGKDHLVTLGYKPSYVIIVTDHVCFSYTNGDMTVYNTSWGGYTLTPSDSNGQSMIKIFETGFNFIGMSYRSSSIGWPGCKWFAFK